ncbi:MAG TPA: hypothetical protein VLL08_12200 [Kineosporiaceae bacterium]|nr:hypothetical protein [Kineosporiaceae bacterium]
MWGKPVARPSAPSARVPRPQSSTQTQPIKRVQPPAEGAAPDVFGTVSGSAPRPVVERTPPPRPPATPFRGFRRPHPSPPSRLALVAGAVAVLIVLSATFFGVQQLTSNSSGSVSSVGPTAASVSETEDPQHGPEIGATGAAQPSKVAELPPQSGAAAKVKLGVFVGTSRTKVNDFGNWLGRDPDYVVDFSSRSTWSDIANPAYMINHWQGSGYQMVYSVALRPWNGNTSIKAGATGAYDEYFRTLARNLVAGGQEDAILRLGWEFNLKGWKWSTDNPDDFIAYWRHIVTAMRSVQGEKLRFDWNPNIGETPYEADLYYPGNKYVDYVGVDVYDISWVEGTYPYPADCNAACRLYRQKLVWERLYSGTYGLLYWADFARTKGKPMSLPEWGLWDRSDGHGGGDDAYFIKQMFAFIDDPNNRVAYHGYLQVDVADGNHKLTTLKKAGQAYKKLFK